MNLQNALVCDGGFRARRDCLRSGIRERHPMPSHPHRTEHKDQEIIIITGLRACARVDLRLFLRSVGAYSLLPPVQHASSVRFQRDPRQIDSECAKVPL